MKQKKLPVRIRLILLERGRACFIVPEPIPGGICCSGQEGDVYGETFGSQSNDISFKTACDIGAAWFPHVVGVGVVGDCEVAGLFWD